MSILTDDYLPDHIVLWHDMQDLEKRAAARMSGVLQAAKSGHLLVGVPTALVRGVFDAMDEPGISLPTSVDGGALRAGIVAMTPEELTKVGGPDVITERGKQFSYQLGSLIQTTARNWPGVTACWQLEIKSPELLKLRRTYGLPTKLPGNNVLSIVVACRKAGVLGTNETSKSLVEQSPTKLPDWTLP
jgi:hypothetical protein